MQNSFTVDDPHEGICYYLFRHLRATQSLDINVQTLCGTCEQNNVHTLYRYFFREHYQNVPFGVQLSQNVLITGTSTKKNLLNINPISKLTTFNPFFFNHLTLSFNRQQIVDDTCYACSSSHYVTTILIHFHNCCRSDMQTSQDPNFIVRLLFTYQKCPK